LLTCSFTITSEYRPNRDKNASEIHGIYVNSNVITYRVYVVVFGVFILR